MGNPASTKERKMKNTTVVKYTSVLGLVNMYLESVGCTPISHGVYDEIVASIVREEKVRAIQTLRHASSKRPGRPFEFLEHSSVHAAVNSEVYDFLNKKDVQMNYQTPHLGLKRAKDVVCVLADLHSQGFLDNTFQIDED